MKKIFFNLALIIGLFFFMPGSILAAGSTLSLSPATGTFNKNCNFSLQVIVDTGGYDTDGTDAILIYDTTRFSANKINNGTIYQDYPGNNIDAQNGKITVSGLSSVGSAYKGAGVLATIDFSVMPDAPAGASQIKFDFDPTNKAKTTDSNVVERGTMAETLSQVVDGSFVVGSGNCGSIGGPSSTPSATIYQPYISKAPTPTPLKQAADTTTTLVVIILAGSLISMGMFGLAKL
jgi:hypothetical protein